VELICPPKHLRLAQAKKVICPLGSCISFISQMLQSVVVCIIFHSVNLTTTFIASEVETSFLEIEGITQVKAIFGIKQV
jgi:hypothetical protein